MNKDHFLPATAVLSRSIAKAETKEELFVIQEQIDHAQEDFKYFNLPGYAGRLADLREQLQERLNEFNREVCGT